MKISLILLALAALVLVTYADPPDVAYSVDKDGHGGGRPSVQVSKLWESADQKTRAEVYANWQRSFGGHMHGDRSHGYGFKISGRF